MIRSLFPALVFALLAVTGGSAGGVDDDWGIGGTGLTDRTQGLGTGRRLPAPVFTTQESDGRGIGGTGIVGTVTAFGSIWVNDLEVHYDEKQPVGIFEGAGTASDLRIGQVVEVIADEKGGRLQARDIAIRHAAAGPVWAIDRGAGTMTLLGQEVLLPAGDPLASTLRQGDRVAVSGLRDDRGRIIASRLDSLPKHVTAFVRGTVESAEHGRMTLAGTAFELPRDINPASLEMGRSLVLYGDPDGNGLRISRLRQEPQLPFDGRVRDLIVEGVVGSSGRRVGPLSLPGFLAGAKAGERVLVRGRVGTDRRLEPASVHLERVIPRRDVKPTSPSNDTVGQSPVGTRKEPRNLIRGHSAPKASFAEPRRRNRQENPPQTPRRSPPPAKPTVRPFPNPERTDPWR